MMPPKEHSTYVEWLYLEPDGELSRSETSALRRHLTSCAGCRAEKREIESLNGLLVCSEVEIDPDFTRRVMEALPAAGWEARHPRTWGWAAAAFAAVGVGAAWILGSSGLGSAVPMAGSVRAVADLFATTAVAGAGLLSASWQGLGLALGEVVGGSKLTLAAFAVFVGGVDFLFVRYLLRRPRKALASVRRDRS